MHSLLVGLGLGFFVALQLGPMSLFLVRSTLAGGWRVGLAIGAGVALIDALYALCGATGAAPLLAIDALRTTLGLLGAAVLVVLGVRVLRSALRPPAPGSVRADVATPRRAFALALAGTASNPLTIASWAAVFAAASAAGAAETTGRAALLVAGVGVGSLVWMTLLASGTALARRAAGTRVVRTADTIAGGALLAFGVALAGQCLAL